MLNVCTPELDNVIVESSHLANYRDHEAIDSENDLVDLIEEIMTDFISPHVPTSGGTASDFASYLGDLFDDQDRPFNALGRRVAGEPDQVDRIDGPHGSPEYQFVVSFSNESQGGKQIDAYSQALLGERHWRLGTPISVKRSNCSNVFEHQRARQVRRGDPVNQIDEDEAEVYTVPVVWQDGTLRVSIGVLALSVRQTGSLAKSENDDLRQRMAVLALPIAAAFGRLVARELSTPSGPKAPWASQILRGIKLSEGADTSSSPQSER